MRSLFSILCLAAALTLPAAAASAMPIDNGPPPLPHSHAAPQAAPPVVRTITRTTSDTPALALAGAALAVAMASAGYCAVRLSRLRPDRRLEAEAPLAGAPV
jgi:hypothetical protein